MRTKTDNPEGAAHPKTPIDAKRISESGLYRRFAGLRVILAETDDRRSEVYALRHRAYVHEGALDPRPSGQFLDRYDLMRTSIVIAVVDGDDAIAGALRFSVQPPTMHGVTEFASAPEFIVFPDAIADLPHQTQPIVSGSRLCIQPEYPRRLQVALLLMMAQLRSANAVGAGWGIASARGSHLAFYERLLAMTPMTEPRPMPGLNLSYALLAADVPTSYAACLKRFPADSRWYFDAACPGWDSAVQNALPTIAQATAA